MIFELTYKKIVSLNWDRYLIFSFEQERISLDNEWLG